MYHARLPPSLRRHVRGHSRDAVADALCFLAIFIPLAVLMWLVFDELIGGNPGGW